MRSWLANAVPEQIKIGFAVGIGMFLVFIGLNETGIVRLGVEGAPVYIGNLKKSDSAFINTWFFNYGIFVNEKIFRSNFSLNNFNNDYFFGIWFR